MPITLKCGCGKQLKVRDELAGKKARCPVCGTIIPIPLPITQKPPVLEKKRLASRDEEELEEQAVSRPKRAASRSDEADDYEEIREGKRARPGVEEDSDESPDLDDEPRRRKKKKKKRSKSFLFMPLLTLFGIDMTPLKLMIVGVVMIMAGFFSFMYFSAPDAKVRVVDVYDLDEDLTEFVHGRPQMDEIITYLVLKEIPRHFILQENSKGTFLVVQFKLSERDMKKLVGERYENHVMKPKDVVLQGDGDPAYPLFIYEPDKNTPSVTVRSKSIFDDDDDEKGKRDVPDDIGPPIEARNKLVQPSEDNPWNHEGVLKINPAAGKSTFEGTHGMVVTFDHGPLPTKELKITWNEKCKFWCAVKQEAVPAEIFLYAWRVTCLFPKPESTKNLTLTVLGRKMKMDYP